VVDLAGSLSPKRLQSLLRLINMLPKDGQFKFLVLVFCHAEEAWCHLFMKPVGDVNLKELLCFTSIPTKLTSNVYRWRWMKSTVTGDSSSIIYSPIFQALDGSSKAVDASIITHFVKGKVFKLGLVDIHAIVELFRIDNAFNGNQLVDDILCHKLLRFAGPPNSTIEGSWRTIGLGLGFFLGFRWGFLGFRHGG